jgi:hypothetical protein
MRAIAGTVQGAPPLRLTSVAAPAAGDEVRLQGHDRHPLDPRWPGRAARPGHQGWRPHLRWSVLAPVAAAVTIVAVAIALVAVRNGPGGAAAPPPASSASPASLPTYTTAAGVPGYYVAWMQADTPYLIVGDTLTGQVRATVKAPGNVHLTGVYGTADAGSMFVVTGSLNHSPAWDTVWYLLRIAPGTRDPVRLTPLAIADTGQPSPAGVALSPDGSEVAVARPGGPATLRVYSVATGSLLRSWSTTASGEITAAKAPPGSWPFTAMALRWSADGRQLAFAWNASAIRVLGAGGPGGDLIGSSRLLAAIGTTYTTGADFTCKAAQGWAPITVARGPEAGQGVICGGGAKSDLPQAVSGTASPTATSGAGHATCTPRNQPSIGFVESTQDGLGESYIGLRTGETECPDAAQASDGAYIGWSNADGSVLIGSQAWDGHARFGIFRGSHFTALPALPVSVPVPAGVLAGTVAW